MKRLSEMFGVAEELLWTELHRVKRGGSSWKPVVIHESPAGVVMTAEDLLAGLLLEDPARVSRLAGRLEMETLKDLQVKRLVGWIMERWQCGKLPQDHRILLSALPREEGNWDGRLARWLAWADVVVEKERTLEELLLRIGENHRRASLEVLQASIRQAETSGDEPTATRLVLEYNRLVKTRRGRRS
jgi:hypothetical protein